MENWTWTKSCLLYIGQTRWDQVSSYRWKSNKTIAFRGNKSNRCRKYITAEMQVPDDGGSYFHNSPERVPRTCSYRTVKLVLLADFCDYTYRATWFNTYGYFGATLSLSEQHYDFFFTEKKYHNCIIQKSAFKNEFAAID